MSGQGIGKDKEFSMVHVGKVVNESFCDAPDCWCCYTQIGDQRAGQQSDEQKPNLPDGWIAVRASFYNELLEVAGQQPSAEATTGFARLDPNECTGSEDCQHECAAQPPVSALRELRVPEQLVKDIVADALSATLGWTGSIAKARMDVANRIDDWLAAAMKEEKPETPDA